MGAPPLLDERRAREPRAAASLAGAALLGAGALAFVGCGAPPRTPSEAPFEAVESSAPVELAHSIDSFAESARAAAAPLAFRRELLGVEFRIVLRGADARALALVADAGFDEARAVELALNGWDPGSSLSRWNADARTGWLSVDPLLAEALAIALRAWRDTDGAFDVRVGGALRALGYHDSVAALSRADTDAAVASADAASDGAPNAAAAARARVIAPRALDDVLRVDVAAARAWRAEPLCIDLDGLSKGLAVARVVARLRELGVRDAYVAAGSSTAFGFGGGTSGRGWEFAPPRAWSDDDRAPLWLRDEAASVSGRHVLADAVADELSLIVDPLTGAPAAHAVVLALFRGPDACEADIASTALIAMGESRAARWFSGRPAWAAQRSAWLWLAARAGADERAPLQFGAASK